MLPNWVGDSDACCPKRLESVAHPAFEIANTNNHVSAKRIRPSHGTRRQDSGPRTMQSLGFDEASDGKVGSQRKSLTTGTYNTGIEAQER